MGGGVVERPLRLMEGGENMVFSSQLCGCTFISLKFAVLLAVKGRGRDVLLGGNVDVRWSIAPLCIALEISRRTFLLINLG